MNKLPDALPVEKAAISDLARQTLHGTVDEATNARGRERMISAARAGASKSNGTQRRRRITRASVLLFAAAALAVSLVIWWPRAPLTFVTTGGEVTSTHDGGVRVATRDAESVTRFSDGSVVTFGVQSAGRLEGVRTNGARVVLTSGELHLDITHRKDTAWSIEAGPYVVRVTGTAFDVAWSPSEGAFVVAMRQGSVVVEGPLTPAGVSLRAGQHLVVARDGVMRMGEGTPPTLAELAVASSDAVALVSSAAPVVVSRAPSAPAEAPPSSSVPAIATSVAPSDRPASFAKLVAEGRYAQVVTAARGRGLEWVAESASLEELVALADAARYEKDGTLARAALEAERKRFATTQAGRNATFLLGRLAEDSDGNTARAIVLYDEYLQTGGPFSAEALGRKMLAVRKTRGDAGAEPIARAYLEKYPKGVYAAAARSIVGTP
ncbi:MAG: FecR domain-containing protein [Polyangiaceae bacterium]|nr:FecR domain-containing protein [Polyangiaceae bacterium]